jgi:hypothetical protein
MDHLTGQYRFRQKNHWWTSIPSVVLQVERQFRNDAAIGGTDNMIKYWADATPSECKAEIGWTKSPNTWEI